MNLALYGSAGYYRQARTRIGPHGDFYTSPTVHPAFGALLAGQILEIWRGLGKPERFPILELGGGRGTLAADMLLALRDGAPDCFAAVAYTLFDLAPAPDLPAAVADRVAFRPADEGLPGSLRGVVIGNEFLDAFPVHRVQKLQGKLQELYVVDRGDRLGEAPGPLSSTDLDLQAIPWLSRLAEGAVAEVALPLVRFLGRLAAALKSGVTVLIDYGADREVLLGRRSGTMRAYRGHRILAGPFDAIGEADLTCHVDFSSLREEAKRYGLAILGETSQQAFLQNLGIAGIHAALAVAPLDPAARAANLAALHDLVAPAGLGAFRVLGLARDCEVRLTGLDGGTPLAPLCAPALTRRHMALWGGNREGAAGGLDVEPPGWAELLSGRVDDLD